jgi:hypothetical protein
VHRESEFYDALAASVHICRDDQCLPTYYLLASPPTVLACCSAGDDRAQLISEPGLLLRAACAVVAVSLKPSNLQPSDIVREGFRSAHWSTMRVLQVRCTGGNEKGREGGREGGRAERGGGCDISMPERAPLVVVAPSS